MHVSKAQHKINFNSCLLKVPLMLPICSEVCARLRSAVAVQNTVQQSWARILYLAKNAGEIRSSDKVSFATYCAIEFNISGELIPLHYQVVFQVKCISQYSHPLNRLNLYVILEHRALA